MNENMQNLLVFQKSANYADYLARFFENQGDATNVQKFLRRRDRLYTEVALLWNQLFDDWSEASTLLVARAGEANAYLEQTMGEIHQDATNGERVIQALSVLDQVIGLAQDVIP